MLLFMEIVRGKAEIVKPKYWSGAGTAAAAQTMRLTEKWWGTGKVVAGDSWFASVLTAEKMLANGLHFIGDVKTGTKRFPADELKEATGEENGSWACMTSSVTVGGEEKKIFAVSHRRGEADKAIHGFVSTCGTTLDGNRHMAYFEDEEHRATGEITEHEIARKCPRVLNDFTTAQPLVDRHNKYRQHLLAMEKRFVTTNFSFRFFTSMLGSLFVNVFMAHRYFNDSLAEFRVELDKLALALMNNTFVDAPSPPRQSKTSSPKTSSPCDADGTVHTLIPLRCVPGIEWKQGMQRRCLLCGKDTTWVCSVCTQGPLHLVPVCPEYTIIRKGSNKGAKVEHECLCKHRLQPGWFPKGKPRAQGTKRDRHGAAEADECEGE